MIEQKREQQNHLQFEGKGQSKEKIGENLDYSQ